MSDTRQRHIDAIERLCDEELPERAQANSTDYPVYLDHCFRRIAYDAAVGDEWTEVVDRPFVANATVLQLGAARSEAAKMRDGGPEVVRRLNQRSLRYRGAADGEAPNA